MSIELRALRLRVTTDKGPVGVTIPFKPGLWVLRADNSSGKSTCVQSIIYALGLEGMLSASHEVPLPHAMTERVEVNGEEQPVLESEVILELGNHEGKVWTVARTVKGPYDKHLIRTWNGPVLTGEGEFLQRDYYVRHPGAATRELGFHHELASFIGWKLPMVARYDGNTTPLYLECIFPLMVVEQKRGWSAIQARMPLHYRIREVGKRAVEFVLGMDAYAIAMKRQQLHEQQLVLRNRWSGLLEEAQAIAAPVGAIVQGVSDDPASEWPPAMSPELVVSVNAEWRSLRGYLGDHHARLTELEKRGIPTVKHQAKELEAALAAEEQKLGEREVALRGLFEEVEREEAQRVSVERKLVALEEDLRKNQDVAKLQKLGSVVDLSIASQECPTCHQALTDALIAQEHIVQPMSVNDNIDFIKEQIATYKTVHGNSLRALGVNHRQLAALRREVDETRRAIRAMKATLTSDERAPSEAAMQERLNLNEQIRRERDVLASFEKVLVRFGEISAEWRNNQASIKALPSDDLSVDDQAKLSGLERLLREEIAAFGLSSVPPGSLGISADLYRPVHQGFDLEFDLSASDMIRTIWAYLLGLLEVSRTTQTNHGKLLVLDEPRQQETARVSFGAFLQRASRAAAFGEQVIFATSEEPAILESLLRDVPHTMHAVTGKILKTL
ncbi:MAG: hypothetical protein JXQ75_00955 [Phycisphaerae bacterium]|nr:hypothetical protein [Phycisphaerae bacterium]